jgi:hypothetical protein
LIINKYGVRNPHKKSRKVNPGMENAHVSIFLPDQTL